MTATVMHLGEMKFKQKSSKDDQAAPDGTEAAKKVATLMGKLVSSYWPNFLSMVVYHFYIVGCWRVWQLGGLVPILWQ